MNNKISNNTNQMQEKARLAGLIIALAPLTSYAQSAEKVLWSEIFSDSNESCFIVTQEGASLSAARQQYEASCPGLERQDCDRVSGNRWMCSSDNIDANTLVPPTSPQSTPELSDSISPSVLSGGVCEAQGSSLGAARKAYALSCPNIPREDCDPLGGKQWVCSSAVIGEASPFNPIDGGVETPTEETPTDSGGETEQPVDISDNSVNEHTYVKNAGPYKNPLKGWNSGWDGGNDHPESSVGFQYIPWKDFEPSDGNFDRGAVEAIIENEGSKNRHLILRLYCDWHGNDAESDCPSWMYTDAGVARLRGDNGRYITDFNDANYIAQAEEAISALASEYDNDPRIYAVQMGVVGYWGEWHAWGSNFSGDGYEITTETKTAILNAYTTSFKNAKIMARYPWREPTNTANGIGFHNDFFVVNNGHSEEFDLAVTTGSQWTVSPIGGEVPPRGDGEASNEKADLFSGSTGQTILEAGHYSTMKAGDYRVEKGQSGYDGYMRLHKMMGYNYQIDVARFANNVSKSGLLSAELVGTNIGVAPMYFDWNVQFALLDANDNPVVMQNSDSSLTSILPGAMFSFSSDIALGNVSAGDYKLAVRIIQPGADEAKQEAWKLDARNTYILFSNDLPVVDGKWVNKRLVGGWSVLGSVAVQ